jgi:hypothetical protein
MTNVCFDKELVNTNMEYWCKCGDLKRWATVANEFLLLEWQKADLTIDVWEPIHKYLLSIIYD